MRKKLLYCFIILFGATTLVSGYIWSTDDSRQTTSSQANSPHATVTEKDENEQRTTSNEQKKLNSVTGYKLQDDKKTTPANTQTQPHDTPTTTKIIPEEIFETKITLQINDIKLLVPYSENMTAEDVMRQANEKYPDKFWYESIEYGGDLGTFVKSINGIAENNREKMYWILYINSKKSNKGISTLILNPDDIIMWNYEKEIL